MELYKVRKPVINNKKMIPELEDLILMNNKTMQDHKVAIVKLKTQIDMITLSVEKVGPNMVKIAELDRILNEECDLPSKLNDIIANMNDNDTDNDNSRMSNLYKSLLSLSSLSSQSVECFRNGLNDFNDIKDTPEYRKYVALAEEYYFTKGLIDYQAENVKSQSDIFDLESKKSLIESENVKIKKEQATIKTIDVQIKQLDVKIAALLKANETAKLDIENVKQNAETDTQIDKLINQTTEIETQKDVILSQIAGLQACLDTKRRIEVQKLKMAPLEMEIDKLSTLISRYDALANVINSNNLIKEELEDLKDTTIQLETEYETNERRYNVEQMALSKYAAHITQYRKDLKEYKELESTVKLWEYYRNALKQLPYILLDKVKPVLERKVNDMLSIVTNFTVTFDMSDNKIDIFLKRSSYRNGQIIINNASGFERFISSLAIRIALLDLSNLPKINFLAIDEGWSCFDTHNINNVNIILDFLKTKFDFIITISHLTAIKEHCDKHIYLKRDNAGYSVISYEE